MSTHRQSHENKNGGNQSPKQARPHGPKPGLQLEQEPLGLLVQRASLSPHHITPAAATRLQRSIGNQDMGQLADVKGNDPEKQAAASFQHILENKTTLVNQVLTETNQNGSHAKPAVIQRQEEEELAQMKPVGMLQRQDEEEETAQMKPIPGRATSSHSATIQRENGNGTGQQQQQLMAPVQSPDDARRDNWSAVRQAVHTVADGMQTRVETLVAALEEIAGIIDGLPITGSAYRRARAQIRESESQITSALEEQMGLSIQAVSVVDNASDDEMSDVMADAGVALDTGDQAIVLIMREVIAHANKAAHIAAQAQAGEAATAIMAQADNIHVAIVNRQTLQELIAARDARGRRRDVAAQVVDVGDVMNNIGALAAGIAGIVELLGVKGASGGAAVGGLGGTLGILFGAIGLGIGLYGIINGALKKKALKKIAPSITNNELKNINQYAQDQKGKAVLGGIAVGTIGAAAIGAGILGLVALSVATFGAAAIVAGIGVALIGLGLVAYKIIHARSKRKAERRAFAEGMVEEIRQGGPKAAEFSFRIHAMDLDPDDAQGDESTRTQLINNLSSKVGDLIKSQRQQFAESLIDFLINGKPSEKFDAELIIKALGRDPEKVRRRVAAGDVKTEVSRLMGKLSSW